MRHPLPRPLSHKNRVSPGTPLSLAIAVLGLLTAASSPSLEAATLDLSHLRTLGIHAGGAVDPVTGKFYERTSFDNDATVRVYSDAAAYEAGTVSNVLTLSLRGFGTYFGVQNGRVYGRSTSGGWYGEAPSRWTEVRRWSGTTGTTELTLGSVPGMGGENKTHTFNWGGFTGVNVMNDNGQLYVFGQKLDASGFLLVKLNSNLTVASSQELDIPALQGFAFIVRGKLFIGSNYTSPTIQRMVDVTTGQITAVSHTFSGPASWYVGNVFYDNSSDRLYVYNRVSGLHRADNASLVLGLGSLPVANAGPDQTALEGEQVTLSAEASYDGNSPQLPLTYSWTQVSGVPVTLANANTATPTFTAPEVPPAGAVLVFEVAVSNPYSEPMTDTVTVTVGSVNFPPIANAGAPQTVPEGAEVTLEGSGIDSDGDALTLSWTQKSGPPVVLHGADSTQPYFTAPAVSSEAGSVELVFTLVVNDGYVNSGPSDVSVHVLNTNAPPFANAGENQSVNERDVVTLDGSQSSDPDEDVLVYSWSQIAGEPLVALNGGNTPTPSFTAPVLDLGGSPEGTTLTFQLSVFDGELTSTGTVNVRVSNVNHAPIADAGEDRTVPENTLISLDGSGSADTDGDTLTYLWEQIDTGLPVELSDSTAASPTFVTPDVGTAGAVLQFQLTVDDGYGGVASAQVAINVTYANRAPIADAGPDGVVEEGSPVIVNGAGSDPDDNEIGYHWVQVSGPVVALNNSFGASPSFIAPQVTRDGDTVVLRLTVSDPYGAEAADEIAIGITNINRAPVAQAPANRTVKEGVIVELIGQGTDLDTEEQAALVYQWQQVGPTVEPAVAGHALTFVAPTLESSDPDASLTFTFRLTVTDPNGASGSDTVTVVVAREPKSPTAVATAADIVDEASSVTLNGTASSDPDDDIASYSWIQTAGPAVTLHEANTATPYFTAPFVNADGATVKFQLTVQDSLGASSTDEVAIYVRNTNDAPIVATARPSIETLWPPDHRMVSISILDVIDTNATVTITSVTQNEPDMTGVGGDVPVDSIISSDGSSVLIRAERIPSGTGRIYTICFVAADFEHSVTGSVKVFVPKKKKGEVVEVSTTTAVTTTSTTDTTTATTTTSPGKSGNAGKSGK